jgi:hypothetical protein
MKPTAGNSTYVELSSRTTETLRNPPEWSIAAGWLVETGLVHPLISSLKNVIEICQ